MDELEDGAYQRLSKVAQELHALTEERDRIVQMLLSRDSGIDLAELRKASGLNNRDLERMLTFATPSLRG